MCNTKHLATGFNAKERAESVTMESVLGSWMEAVNVSGR
jgi:hypothetical protein